MAGRKVVIVTGAARGLGREMARGLLCAGHCVAALDLPGTESLLASIATENGRDSAFPITADITLESSCEVALIKIVGSLGPPWALINNAALGMERI